MTPRTRRILLTALGSSAALAAAMVASRRPAAGPALPSIRRGDATGASPRSEAYNVLLIVTDQERFDLPGTLPLPGHERLRERGMSFNQWQVHTTPCSPSRSNLYFGQHTQHTRMHVNLGVFPEPQIPAAMPSLGHYFRANGWQTAYKGKWHLSELRAHYELTYGRYPSSRHALEPFGFSDFNFDGDPHGATWTGYRTDAQIAAESAQWLHGPAQSAGDRGEPWLLAVNFVNPHDVMFYSGGEHQQRSRRERNYLAPLAQPPFDPFYRPRWAAALPANRHDDLRSKPSAHAAYQVFCDMAFGRIIPTDEAWLDYQNYYFNCIRDADRHLATVLDALDASGMADRTVVVFTSDHGEMAGAHGLRQKGPFIYQENVRVPFIVRHPDVRGGTQTEALGGAIDLIPTLLELAGLEGARIREAYPRLVGHSVASAVALESNRTRRDQLGVLYNYNTTHYLDNAFNEALASRGVTADAWMPLRALMVGQRPLPRTDHPALFRGIHTGRYKFARYFSVGSHHQPHDWATLIGHNQLELYDLEKDPLELDNLAAQPARVDGRVRAQILELNQRTNALVAAEVGEDLGDELPGPSWLKRL